MKTLIAYAGKAGTTKRAAELLAKEFGNVDLCDLCKEQTDPGRYDLVIIGSAVRYGRVHKAVRTYLVKNWEVLKEKRKALFLCNAAMEQALRILQMNYSPELLNGCIAAESFGGTMDPECFRGFDKLVAKMYGRRLRKARGMDAPMPSLSEERIKEFAGRVKEFMHGD